MSWLWWIGGAVLLAVIAFIDWGSRIRAKLTRQLDRAEPLWPLADPHEDPADPLTGLTVRDDWTASHPAAGIPERD